MHPLNLGTPDQFRALRLFLSESGYTEQAVRGRLGLASIYEFKTLREGRSGASEIVDRLDALIRLLMDEEAVELATLEQHFGTKPLEVMRALGISKPLSNDPARVYADAVLYPQEGLFIASDRTFLVDPQPGLKLPDDVVYASITKNTGRFVSILPSDPCDSFLDLCAGTGIAALIAGSRYAKNAWSCDLSKRCAHFSEFNSRLNDVVNTRSLQGDLYAPVNGLTFDRIVAHPPYVPAPEQKIMFRDGGEDGEQILRGIIQGLPRFLRPGGRFYTLSLASDREQESLEQRVRLWLGEAESEFDVLSVVGLVEPRPDTLLKAIVEGKGKLGEPGPRSKMFDRLKVQALIYGTIVIERHAEQRAPITARCQKSLAAGSETIEWFRKWHLAAARPGFEQAILASRPRLSSEFRLLVVHAWRDGQLSPIDFRMKAEQPFRSDARAEPWIAVLVGGCDGATTGAELYERLRAAQVISPDMTDREFAGVLRVLMESGFVEMPEFPLPLVDQSKVITPDR